MMWLLDIDAEFSLFDYLVLRKINKAVQECGDSGTLSPAKIYCALTIATPRAKDVSSTEESVIFRASVALTDGFYFGQTSYLSLEQIVAMVGIYNYFSDYELPF